MKKILFMIVTAMAVMFTGCATIDETERGVLLEFGSFDQVLDPGLTIYNAFTKSIVTIPVKTQLETVTMNSGSKDMQNVDVQVAVNYKIDPTKIEQTYKQFGQNVVDVGLVPQIKAVITGVTPQYIPEEMLQKREEIRQRMEATLKQKLDSADIHILVENLTITSFSFSAKFRESIEEKQIAEQNALREKHVTEQLREQNAQSVAKARADSTVIALQMAALQKQTGKDYLMLKYLEKWDGHLPQVSGASNTVVMPDIK